MCAPHDITYDTRPCTKVDPPGLAGQYSSGSMCANIRSTCQRNVRFSEVKRHDFRVRSPVYIIPLKGVCVIPCINIH